MDVSVENKKRSIIPRWRDFQTTMALGELASAGSRKPLVLDVPKDAIDSQLMDFNRFPSIGVATDLVGAAIVLGLTTDIGEAVQFILSDDSGSTDLNRMIARTAIEKTTSYVPPDLALTEKELIQISEKKIREHRAALEISLRNPIRLVELAREFAVLGSQKKAIRIMEVAVGLAPANRFVLRSAARLFIHSGMKERAHQILRRAASLPYDPWLLSAEIAVASIRDLTSTNMSKGIILANDSGLNPFDVSELSSAVATVEMKNGKIKNAKKLFRRSLQNPTDNSVAQVEWASRNSVEVGIDTNIGDVANNFEAPAWNYYSNGQLEEALGLGQSWMRDQPFAATPVGFTGMVANILEQHSLAEQIYSFGLRANPKNYSLRNNLAFTLASSDNPVAAQAELDRIEIAKLKNTVEKVAVTATQGLIYFRKGMLVEGRNLYLKAIKLAKDENESTAEIRALTYLAREEINSFTPEAIKTFAKLEEESKKFRPNQELTKMLSSLSGDLENKKLKLLGRTDER